MQYEIITAAFDESKLDQPKDGETYFEREEREYHNAAIRRRHRLDHDLVRFYETDEDDDGNETRDKEIAAFTYDELLSKFWAEYWDEKDLDPDYRPQEMEMIGDYMDSLSDKTDILFRAFYGHNYHPYWLHDSEPEFNPNMEWFAFNGYGNLVSINGYLLTMYCAEHIDFDDLAKWVAENKDEDDLD